MNISQVQPDRNLFHHRKVYAAVAMTVALAGHAHAAPNGGTVVGGEGSITHAGNDTTIVQETNRLAIDWESFNIAADERVEFIQPTQESLALNRIIGNDGSEILGRLDANGHVVLVNPNGIIFGNSAQVNVGGLVASGLDVDASDFINGDLRLRAVNGRSGLVINHGVINASTGGNLALVGTQVANEGLISAQLGSVTLAAGREAVLTFDPQGFLGVRVTRETLQRSLGTEAAVLNSGRINAPSGRVLLTASTSQDVFSQAVNAGDLVGNTEVLVHDDGSFTLGRGANLVNSGTVTVSATTSSSSNPMFSGSDGRGSVVLLGEQVQHSGLINANNLYNAGEGGTVVLAASGRNRVSGSGTIVAHAGAVGGSVTLLGREVTLADYSGIGASGGVSGGTISVGGRNSAGGSQLTNTDFTLVGANAQVLAQGFANSGKGGNVNVWSRSATLAEGRFSTRSQTGDGGVIGLASEGLLSFNGSADLTGNSAAAAGSLNLAASQLSVAGGNSLFSINQASLQQAMASGNVSLSAAGDLELGRYTPVTLELRHNFSLAAGRAQLSGLTLDNSRATQATQVTLEADLFEGLPRIGVGYPDFGQQVQPIHLALTAHEGSLLHTSNIHTYGGNYSARAAGDIVFEDAYLHLAPQEFGDTDGAEVDVLATAGGDIALRIEDFRPSLTVEGANVDIRSIWGFYAGQIVADNLTLSTIGAVESTAKVSGTTHLMSEAGADWDLSGDFNLLTADFGYVTNLHLTEENDLLLGDINAGDSSLSIILTGGGATLAQAPDTRIVLSDSVMALAADNIELGASGTSQILTGAGFLDINFHNSLLLDGLIDQSSSFDSARIYGSDSDNQFTIGSSFSYLPSEFGMSTIDLGAGDDLVDLAADLPIPLTLGEGANIINLLAPDLSYTFEDFDEERDTLNPYTP